MAIYTLIWTVPYRMATVCYTNGVATKTPDCA